MVGSVSLPASPQPFGAESDPRGRPLAGLRIPAPAEGRLARAAPYRPSRALIPGGGREEFENGPSKLKAYMDKTVPTKQWHPILKTAWQMCSCSMTVTTNKSSLLNEDIRYPPQPVPASGTLLPWGKDSLVTLQLQFGSVPPHLAKLSIETNLSSLLGPVWRGACSYITEDQRLRSEGLSLLSARDNPILILFKNFTCL
ncbi:uncharacterized protein LOC120409435 isoform X2 [Mauremys reevesii]|uniref:uncharacterized protein LOC120409435 isoform X2 n=1 Tax=Mauremys reevesii TaxID=260615 RepID=UPI00193EF726|nr:uncharacterized protein LOC120409435 isoform X2 [Mauremys reevesii]